MDALIQGDDAMELLVTIRDKIADYKGKVSYVCGNSDFVICFDMDEEWAAHETKTARFVKEDGTYKDQVFTGNICPVPVISNTWGIMVGVFAGNLHTTTSAYIPAKKSILCASGMPSAPSDDVYAQIMQKIDDGLLKGEKGDKGEPGEPGEKGEPGKDADPYTLPTASADTLGGVKVGSGLRMDGDVLEAEVQKEDVDKLSEEIGRIVEKVSGINLFNKNGTDYVNGYFMPDGTIRENNAYKAHYLKLDGLGTYTFYPAHEVMGASSRTLTLYDKNKNYIGANVGTYDEKTHIVTVNVTKPGYYAGYTVKNTNSSWVMFVRGDEYPDTYYPFGELLQIKPSVKINEESLPSVSGNVLHEKTAAFDGDSICAGVGDTADYVGWAGRIGESNNMAWRNYGVGGGTIAAETYSGDVAKHWICRSIDTIYANTPNLDYLILEGGTNDADILNSQDKKGTFDDSDYSGTYDDTTYCGGLESLLYKAVTYYPHAKIGFIIAPKMGVSNNGYGDENTRYTYFKTAMDICKKWGVPVINLWDESHLNPKLQVHYNAELGEDENVAAESLYTDGQHLTGFGYDVITPKIEAWMRTL